MRSFHSFLICSVSLVLSLSTAHAAELSGVKWIDNPSGDQTIELMLDGHPGYQLDELSSGMAVKLTLKGTSLDAQMKNLVARGLLTHSSVKSSDDVVTLNLTFNQKVKVGVIPSGNGYQLRLKSSQKSTANQPVSGNGELTQISFSRVSGDRVQLDLSIDGDAGTPAVFRTVDPPRIAFDFYGVSNGTGKQSERVSIAAVDSVLIAADDNRMRLVLNLLSPADYQLTQSEKGYVLTVASNTVSNAEISSETASVKKVVAAKEKPEQAHQITSIDFRRSQKGAGRIIVKLSDSQMAVDLNEIGGEIIAVFPNTSLPDDLEQRLDVVDFATPVTTVDTFSDGGNVKMIITPVGEYKQSSVQSGNTLLVDVAPLSKEEEELGRVDEFGYSGESLSLNFQRISVRAALQVIADFTGLNFVTSDAITGNLSLRLKDVPWDQALDVILQTKGLAMRQKGNVVWVAPAAEIRAKEKQALEAQQEVGDLEPLVSELIHINYAKAEAIAEMLKSIKAVETGVSQNGFGSVSFNEITTETNSLLSSRGSVTVDNRTNSLLIQDTPSKLREIRSLIDKLDIPVRQVQIETRIVQANEDFSRTVGARLGFSRVTQAAQFPGSSGSNVGDVYSSGTLEGNAGIRAGNIDNGALSVSLPASAIGADSPGSYAFTLAKLGSGYLSLLDLEISALQAEGNGKILANPKILTTDSHRASIEQGQDRVATFSSAFGTVSQRGSKAVLSLSVLPQITPDDKITLDVNITNDSFVDAVSDTINTKRISTQTLLENGETVVIGGIYTQDQSFSESKIPILGDLPLVGNLFRKKSNRNSRTELLIFLTPRIIDPALAVQ